MGTNYKFTDSNKSAPRRGNTHPVMRGIGCILMVIVPLLSYGAGSLLAQQNFGSQILPISWYGRMTFPDWAYRLTGLNFIANFLSSIDRLPATLALSAIVLIVFGGILSVLWGYMYSLLAPSKYGPFDVPPPRVKTKKYKR